MGRETGEGWNLLRKVGQPRQPGFLGERDGLLEAALAPRAEDPELDPGQGDVVEHQRDDDLVDPEPRSEDARDQAPQRPAGERREDDQHDVDRSGQSREREPDERARDRSDGDLALAADVEQVGLEPDRDRQPGEDQRGGGDDRLRDR
jgi:hypothetical protein